MTSSSSRSLAARPAWKRRSGLEEAGGLGGVASPAQLEDELATFEREREGQVERARLGSATR